MSSLLVPHPRRRTPPSNWKRGAAQFVGEDFHTSFSNYHSIYIGSFLSFAWLSEKGSSRNSADWHMQHIIRYCLHYGDVRSKTSECLCSTSTPQALETGSGSSIFLSMEALKRKGERGQPCPTPLDVLNSSQSFSYAFQCPRELAHDALDLEIDLQDSVPSLQDCALKQAKQHDALALTLDSLDPTYNCHLDLVVKLERCNDPASYIGRNFVPQGATVPTGGGSEIVQRLERERTDRKVRGSNPASASRLPLSRLGQPGSIPALVLPSGGMAARHRKGATAERFYPNRANKAKRKIKSSMIPYHQ
ncbi:hypothetical protein CSKR_100613 [Clonorchis sinensis]|uniref:Uncharacterized protein n=1 Tax=Clonorchis sinensis TaxID=79923 RepID=A0A419PG77_CLOSI|nr:hypothetical protein CSKR_100613 [Clonorchis sinensis]